MILRAFLNGEGVWGLQCGVVWWHVDQRSELLFQLKQLKQLLMGRCKNFYIKKNVYWYTSQLEIDT